MEKNFRQAGKWWNGNQEQIEKSGKVYALYGWNGESYADSWEVINRTESAGKYDIKPVYTEDTDGDFFITDYEITSR